MYLSINPTRSEDGSMVTVVIFGNTNAPLSDELLGEALIEYGRTLLEKEEELRN